MEKITSFTIDHLKLQPGVYVSRIDYVEGHPVTTFDLRMTSPNEEPVMNTAEMHTIEHLAATFCAIIPNSAEKPFISAPWAAAPASTFFWQENKAPPVSSRS